MDYQINLLPWREQERSKYQRRFISLLCFGVILSVAVQWGAAQYLEQQNAIQVQRNRSLDSHIGWLNDELKEFKVSEDDIKTFITTVGKARDYKDNESRKIIKNILSQCIKKLSVHLDKKRLSYYGYPNICNNALVNVIDVEFYSEKNLSIFVCSETNILLFTRIDNEFSNDAMGSYTEDELIIWNNEGKEALDNVIKNNIVDNHNTSSPENLWFGSDVASMVFEAMLDELDEE
jgi:hypothetical protein